jgi:hypothetical protein
MLEQTKSLIQFNIIYHYKLKIKEYPNFFKYKAESKLKLSY